MARVLALDVGSKRIGVAVSDELRLTARPYGMIPRETYNKNAVAIATVVTDLGADRVVVGLPLGPAGNDTEQTARTRRFADMLSTRLPVPVEMWDETLTTVAAKAIVPAGRKARQTGRVDAVAAAVLLQSYLDHHFQAQSSLES